MSEPVSNPTNEFVDRKRKLAELKEAGIQTYVERFERTHTTSEALQHAEKNPPRALEAITADPQATVKLCGRLTLMRHHGKLTFAHLKDVSGKIQICFMQDFVGVDQYKLLRKIDIGDFIGVTGELFVTKHGETTLLVKEYTLLSKTLRPLPEKFHCVHDTETKYRYRYLDLLSDENTWARFQFRTQLTKEIRTYLDAHQFMEVETPILT